MLLPTPLTPSCSEAMRSRDCAAAAASRCWTLPPTPCCPPRTSAARGSSRSARAARGGCIVAVCLAAESSPSICALAASPMIRATVQGIRRGSTSVNSRARFLRHVKTWQSRPMAERWDNTAPKRRASSHTRPSPGRLPRPWRQLCAARSAPCQCRRHSAARECHGRPCPAASAAGR